MTRENVLTPLTPVATLGFFRAVLRRVRHGQPPSPPLIVQELAARHETLLAQIQAVDDSASSRPRVVVGAERAVLQAAAASVFEALEQHRATLGPAADPKALLASQGDPPRARKGGATLGFIVGVAVATYLVGMALVVAGPKPAPRTAGTGQAAPTVPGAAQDVHPTVTVGHPGPVTANDIGPEEAAARAAMAKNPEDVEARLELSRLRLDQQDFMSVWEETKRILEADPGNPRALSYQSQVRLAMGQPDVALELLRRALAKDPLLLQAYIYQSQVHLRMGQQAEAKEAIEEAKRRYPAQAAWLDSGLRQMTTDEEKRGLPAREGEADPHGGLGGPSGSEVSGPPHGRIVPGPDTADLASIVGPTVSGTLELDAALQGRIPANAVVFLTVREAGLGAGPPVAAKRLSVSFPQAFTVGPADSMQGERLPDVLFLEARVDTDADASTRDASDPEARKDDVRTGATGVRLLLKRP